MALWKFHSSIEKFFPRFCLFNCWLIFCFLYMFVKLAYAKFQLFLTKLWSFEFFTNVTVFSWHFLFSGWDIAFTIFGVFFYVVNLQLKFDLCLISISFDRVMFLWFLTNVTVFSWLFLFLCWNIAFIFGSSNLISHPFFKRLGIKMPIKQRYSK